MSVINLRKRYEMAIGKVLGESFAEGPEDVIWWVGLTDLDMGPCEDCGEQLFRPGARVHITIFDHQGGRLAELNGDLPTILSPHDIREATKQMIDRYRINMLEDDLMEADHIHHHLENEDESGA